MTIDDIKHIFRNEIARKDQHVYFMLDDANDDYDDSVIRHEADDLESLVPLLDCFIYDSTEQIPRFRKG